MHNVVLRLALVPCLCASVQAQSVRLVAATGQAAPGGGTYNQLGSLPAVVAPGRIAFTSSLLGVGTPALFADSSTGVRLIARNGDAAPNGFAYVFSGLPPFTATNGRVAFITDRQNLAVPMASFRWNGSTVEALAQRGQALPNDSGELFNLTPSPTMNPAGQVGFTAFVNDPVNDATQGMFVATPGGLQTIALDISPAPGGGFFFDFNGPVINASGQVAFYCQLYDDTSDTNMGVFVGPIGGLQQVARTGQAAPAGGTYREFLDVGLNHAGDVVFFAQLSGALQGIFVGCLGAVSAVAIAGEPAPGGGVYASIDFPSINGLGQVAFRANMAGGPATQGVFLGKPGNIVAIAKVGDQAPDLGAYRFFDANPATNNRGEILFSATSAGSGITADNDYALYGGRPGALRKIVRTGEQFDLDPGPAVDLRTVYNVSYRGSGGEDGFGPGLGDDGTIAVWLQFRDSGRPDARAVAVSQLPDTAPALLEVRSRKRHGG